jgi:signal transduction histidine kinase
MYLSSKMILFNLFAKGLILLVFLMSGPFFFNYFALKNTDAQLDDKRVQVLDIIAEEGIENFFTEEQAGFGSYNILKEEYILLEKLAEPYLIDTIYNQERIIEEQSVPYRVNAYGFAENEEHYLLEIGRSLGTIKETQTLIYKIMIGSFLFFLILTFFLDIAFNKRLVKPFMQIIKTKISHINEPQEFNYTPIKTSTIDFQILDRSISEMMKRIQKAFNDERVFISHASHELKTPISILQTKIEGLLYSESLDERDMERLMDMQETVQKFKKTINSLLLLSKVNNAQFIKTESVESSELLEEIHEEWDPMAEEKDITLKLSANDPFLIKNTNVSLCRIMIQNVILNAIKYIPEGGKIEIQGTVTEQGYQISIKDSGQGISDELLGQVEEGIVKLKDAKIDKSGFGLQIIFKIALYLGVETKLNSDYNGTEFIFRFPN